MCPQCQRPAAVGVHCVDCVAEAVRAAPSQRTALGGRVRGGRPVVTLTLIGLNAISYLLQLTTPTWTSQWAFSPVVGSVQPYRFLTAAFLHSPASFLHIVFNMVALWTVGPLLEQLLGRARYLTLYLMAAVGGSVGAVLLAPVTHTWTVAIVGASGAVFGLFGAILVVLRRVGGDVRGILGVIAVNLVIGFVPGLGIAWQAHVGGLVVGLLLGFAYAHAPAPRRQLVALVAPVVMAVLLVASTVLTYRSVGLL